jgi:hypothetical protein
VAVAGQPRICIVSASGQNVFFAEILDAFAAALRDHGIAVEESVDHFPPVADDLVYLFVPHEYHPLVHLLAHPTPEQLRRSVALCTEQPGSPWFGTSAAIAAEAGAAIDINVLGVEELARQGVKVEHAPLGYVPAWDVWHRDEARERPTAVTFLGGYTQRRGELLARCVPTLIPHRSAIHLVSTDQPNTAATRSFLSGERKWNLLADSRILLNVHQEPRPYMEWHRVIGAALNGCVVLSEHSSGTEPFVPGEHFVSSSYEHLPSVLHALLEDPDRLARIRLAAYDLLREQMPLSASVAALMRAVERAAVAPVGLGGSPPPATPMPIALPQRKPGWEAEAEIIGEQRPTRTALKHLVVQVKRLERQVQILRSGDDPAKEVTIERYGPHCENPRVSVLLTLYNYADYVGDALHSVGLSELDEIEVVVVDDASTDDSVNAVRVACEQLAWLPVTLVRRAKNGGLSAARNLAASHAKSDLLFMLDADNLVLPRGLGLLASALEENPDAAFAYGIIQTFGVNRPGDLISWPDWDPARLRYGNYIDAMAMIRRSALESVGGYSTDGVLSMGWEDFALWVALAHHGMSGLRVPDFVGRYRVNPHSMLSLTDIDNSAVWAALLRMYPSLALPPAPEPVDQAA